MLALRYHEYGGPEVLTLEEAEEPHAGPGQVRIAVKAVSVNPFDWKLRAGYMDGIVPATFPVTVGTDATGVVDEVGEGVDGVAVGDAVFGIGSATSAEFAVLTDVATKPESMSFEQAAGFGLGVETGARALDRLDMAPGGILLVDGAGGGVGSALVQFAVARGCTVIGTGSQGQHDYLASLGATPTTYGEGLAERVAELAPGGIDGAVDVVGKGSVPALIAITGDPTKVVTVADFTAYPLGVHVADSSRGRATYALAEAARLFTEGRFQIAIDKVLPLSEAAEAHRLSQDGHVRGKLVLTLP